MWTISLMLDGFFGFLRRLQKMKWRSTSTLLFLLKFRMRLHSTDWLKISAPRRDSSPPTSAASGGRNMPASGARPQTATLSAWLDLSVKDVRWGNAFVSKTSGRCHFKNQRQGFESRLSKYTKPNSWCGLRFGSLLWPKTCSTKTCISCSNSFRTAQLCFKLIGG